MSENVFVASSALTNCLIKKGLEKKFTISDLKTTNIDTLSNKKFNYQFVINKFRRSIRILDSSGFTVSDVEYITEAAIDKLLNETN